MADEKEKKIYGQKTSNKISPGMRLFWAGFLAAGGAFLFEFIGFCSPYWYQSWRRVHSPLANVGLWHICLSGYIKPKDPTLQSYVGCWWIHSSFFRDVQGFIMPRMSDFLNISFIYPKEISKGSKLNVFVNQKLKNKTQLFILLSGRNRHGKEKSLG